MTEQHIKLITVLYVGTLAAVLVAFLIKPHLPRVGFYYDDVPRSHPVRNADGTIFYPDIICERVVRR